MCTLMAGVMLVILGATGLGSAVKFIPRPVVVAFTNGIAVIIASTQIKDFFGLKVDKVPGEFLARMEVLAKNFRTLSPPETGLGVLALVLILLFMRFVKRVPGYIVALFVGTALVMIFKLPVETIGTRFGGIPSGFPGMKIPQFRFDLLRPLNQAEFEQHIGAGNICPSIADALERARVLNAEIERQGLQIASGGSSPAGIR
jgi:sulfate permease, SulP family